MDEISFDEAPIRCITCRMVLAHYQERVKDLISKGHSFENVFEQLDVPARPCCRINIMAPVLRFYQADEPIEVNRVDPSTGEAVFDLSAIIRDVDGMAMDDLSSLENIPDNPFTLSKPRIYSTTTMQLSNFKYWQLLLEQDDEFYDMPPRPKETPLKRSSNELTNENSKVRKASAPKASAPKASAPKASAPKAAAPKAAATDIPTSDTTVTDAPVRKASVSKAPVRKVPAPDDLARKAPASKVSTADTLVSDTTATDVPVRKASVRKAPVRKSPADDDLASDTPVRKASVRKAPAKKKLEIEEDQV